MRKRFAERKKLRKACGAVLYNHLDSKPISSVISTLLRDQFLASDAIWTPGYSL